MVLFSKDAFFSMKRVMYLLLMNGYATGPPSVTERGVPGETSGAKKELTNITNMGESRFLQLVRLSTVSVGGQAC